jgi:hypothetical protein
VLGDHQPAANVSGERASWDVPVQIVSDHPDLVARLRNDGFQIGTTPPSQAIGRMQELGPMLIRVFNQ